MRCVSTHGDASLDLLQKSAEFINARYTERGQRTCILYFGDHDAAGLTISEGLHEHLCEVHMIPEACRVVRVAVTLEQITDPRHPLPTRFSEHNERDKKAEWYECQHPGVGYVDLDAIAPRTLVTLARAAIQATIADPAAWREQAQRERALRRDLLDAIERHSAEYDALWRASGEEER